MLAFRAQLFNLQIPNCHIVFKLSSHLLGLITFEPYPPMQAVLYSEGACLWKVHVFGRCMSFCVNIYARILGKYTISGMSVSSMSVSNVSVSGMAYQSVA